MTFSAAGFVNLDGDPDSDDEEITISANDADVIRAPSMSSSMVKKLCDMVEHGAQLTKEELKMYGDISGRAQDYLFQERYLPVEGALYEVRMVPHEIYEQLSEGSDQTDIEEGEEMLERSFGVVF